MMMEITPLVMVVMNYVKLKLVGYVLKSEIIVYVHMITGIIKVYVLNVMFLVVDVLKEQMQIV